MTDDERLGFPRHPSTGKAKGPTLKIRAPSDLQVCQASDVVAGHSLHVKPKNIDDSAIASDERPIRSPG